MADMVHNLNVKVYITDSSKLADKERFQALYDNATDYRKDKVDKAEAQRDKQATLAAGALLTRALKEAGYNEQELELQFNNNGKPFFAQHPELDFSLAYSGDRAMCAVAVADGPLGAEIGCDVEENTKELAEYLDEYNMTADKWTRLESYAKATQSDMKSLFYGSATVIPGFIFSHPELDDNYKYNICCRTQIPSENMVIVEL
jgi:phosphopantetheinyl transferase